MAQARVHVGFDQDRDELTNACGGIGCELGFDLGSDQRGINADAEPNLQ